MSGTADITLEYNSTLPTATDGKPVTAQSDSRGRQLVVPITGGAAGVPAGDVVSVQGVASGTALNVGAGVAGTPAGGVSSVQGVAGGTALPVSLTVGLTATQTITRPSDTTTYGVADVVGITGGGTAAIPFALGAVSGSSIMIRSVSFQRDAPALIASETTYFLYLYTVTPPSALADNVAFDIPSGDRASFVGKIALGTPVDEGSTLYIETNGVNKQVRLTGTGLFGYLVTTGNYQPASAAVHRITMHAEQM